MSRGRQLPASFTAGRRLALEGVTYAKGATIPNNVVARTHNVDGLLSRRWIIPNVEAKPLRQNNSAKSRPTHLNAAEKRALLT